MNRIFEFEPDTHPTLPELVERVHPDDLAWIARIQSPARTGHDDPGHEIRLRMPDGRLKWIRLVTRVNRVGNGGLECLGIVQDVTRSRLAEDSRDRLRSELAHASRLMSLGVLTASIAHEIKQPLASIIMNGETGLRRLGRLEPDLEKVRTMIGRVVGDAQRAADIIDQIQTTANRGSTTRSEIALAEIVTESTAFLRHEFGMHNVSVSLDLAPGLPTVIGDRTQLQQIVVNLAINAVQALSVSGVAEKSIVFRTQRIDAKTLCCIVEDSGPGIDAEHLPHLFDSFFTTKETGMGLGLAIAQSILEAHGGRIRADNASALGGARFVFELPVTQ